MVKSSVYLAIKVMVNESRGHGCTQKASLGDGNQSHPLTIEVNHQVALIPSETGLIKYQLV